MDEAVRNAFNALNAEEQGEVIAKAREILNRRVQNIKSFDYNGQEVRTVEISGQPWFVAADVCNYFGVTNRNRIMQQVDEEDKGGYANGHPWWTAKCYGYQRIRSVFSTFRYAATKGTRRNR